MIRVAKHTTAAFTTAFLFALLVALHAADVSQPPAKPNIVFIMPMI